MSEVLFMAEILLEHVAQEAKVSSTTASLVLNNKLSRIRISDATRQRVKKAADKLQYHPNFAARMLAKCKTSMIGVEMNSFQLEGGGNIILDFQRVFERQQYSLVLNYSENNVEGERRHLSTFAMKRMDGIIVWPIFGHEQCPEPIRQYMKEGKPVITVAHRWYSPDVPYVVLDNVRGGYLATKYLLDLGHRRIGIIHLSDIEWGCAVGHSVSHDRYCGYQKAYQDAALDVPNLIYPVSDEQLARKVLQDDVTAVLCFNDSTSTIQMMRGFLRQGIAIPKDISVVSFGDRSLARLANPILTTMAWPKGAWTLVAGKMLDMIESEKVENAILKPELIEGESCSRPLRQDG